MLGFVERTAVVCAALSGVTIDVLPAVGPLASFSVQEAKHVLAFRLPSRLAVPRGFPNVKAERGDELKVITNNIGSRATLRITLSPKFMHHYISGAPPSLVNRSKG
jgi:hypothetical protein